VQNTVNPFSTQFWQAGVFPFQFADETTLETLFRQVVSNRFSQIVGPHGSGKSTLLQNIAKLATRQGLPVNFALLNSEQRKLPIDFLHGIKNGGEKKLFLLDGYEQLPLCRRFLLRYQFRNKAAHLVWTTHTPAWFVPVLYKTNPKFECFRQLAEILLEKQNVKIDEACLKKVFTESNGNFRDAFMSIYDVFEPDSPMV